MPATSLFARGLVALLVAGGLSVAEAPAPASASSTRLCLGYNGCANAGYSNAGYQQKSGTMWWRMYSGHNCTNYVAYRMVKSGLANSRPWSGSGNATNWGVARSDITDQTPKVGAVAWWRAYARPAGSAGHVAYVEKVISNDEIVVSQDSWGGDFSWARITRAGGSWPSGFVHFNDIGLRHTANPVITGTAQVGSVLTSSTGTWSPSGATFTYQWRADGTNIAGATGPTFTPGSAQQGKKISVLVQAAKAGFPTAHAYAAQTAPVLPGVLSSVARPTVTGTPRVDLPLTVSAGS